MEEVETERGNQARRFIRAPPGSYAILVEINYCALISVQGPEADSFGLFGNGENVYQMNTHFHWLLEILTVKMWRHTSCELSLFSSGQSRMSS